MLAGLTTRGEVPPTRVVGTNRGTGFAEGPMRDQVDGNLAIHRHEDLSREVPDRRGQKEEGRKTPRRASASLYTGLIPRLILSRREAMEVG